uniref:Uncharacterized protein n=1 Tax=candidate division WOR-3 bacterium TaxID=2052148 RepID=A0A7C2K4U9_UNCW3
MSSTFKSKLNKIIEEISVNEVQDALKRILERRPENIVEGFLEEINFGRKLRAHPLVGKTIDFGNLMRYVRRSEYYKKLNEELIKIMEQQAEIEDIIEMKRLLESLRNQIIDYIVAKAGESEQGLRHIHAPGSVARSEARNLYFGEKYTQENLYWLASRLCDSIVLGENIGIYSENESLMSYLRQLASQHFKSTFRIELSDLEISGDEADHPYAVILGFILWLGKRLWVEEKPETKAFIHSILDNLKKSAISLFFMSGEKEKWSTIGLPRLDIFIERWILNEESRVKIETLRSELNKFIIAVRRESKREKKLKEAENFIDLLMSNYEAFCRRLIEHGNIDLYAIRRLMDIIVDLGTRYNLKIYLGPLGSVIGY